MVERTRRLNLESAITTKLIRNQNKPVLLFDGVCRLCNAWCKFIIAHDKNQHFLLCSVQSEEGQALLRHFNYPTNVFDTMLLLDRGKMHEKSEAFFRVMKQLPLPWSWLLVFRILPRSIRDWLYDKVAQNRYKLFGRKEVCLVPTSRTQHRFLRLDHGPG